MARYKKEKEEDDGWTRWVFPEMSLYKMACCDCGLVHDLAFEIVEVEYNDKGYFRHKKTIDGLKVRFKARRNNRATGQIRRRKKPID